jgi:hypothetical protein
MSRQPYSIPRLPKLQPAIVEGDADGAIHGHGTAGLDFVDQADVVVDLDTVLYSLSLE